MNQQGDVFKAEKKNGSIQNQKPHNNPAKGVRSIAFDLLHRIWKSPDDNVPLPVLIKERIEKNHFTVQDTAFFSSLVYTILRHYGFIDEKITGYCHRFNSLSSAISLILRMGIAELFFLHTPPHAVVNEYVKMSRRFGKIMAGLINGVLRRASSEYEEQCSNNNTAEFEEICDVPADDVKSAEPFSLPSWIFSLWLEQYGQKKAVQYAGNTLFPPVPCWRINLLKDSALSLREQWLNRGFLPVGEYGFYLSTRNFDPNRKHQVLIELSQLEEQGKITRQGMASQLASEKIAEILAPVAKQKDFSLWDACCGRGGKSISLMEKGIPVQYASDPSSLRIEEMKKELNRLKLPFPELLCSSAQSIKRNFSAIILDAPCSGTGTLARNPELKFRLTPEKLQNAALLQKKLLEHTWHCLKKNGLLFYLTCALNKEENELQLLQFLSTYSARLEYEQLFDRVTFGQDILYLSVLRKLTV